MQFAANSSPMSLPQRRVFFSLSFLFLTHYSAPMYDIIVRNVAYYCQLIAYKSVFHMYDEICTRIGDSH